VEREATPQLLMKLSIQLNLAEISVSNTVSFLYIFEAYRAAFTVHNCVHKAHLQPKDGQQPDHVTIDKTVIQLDDEHHTLYAAVDPDRNKRRHKKVKTVKQVLALTCSLTESARNTPSTTQCFWSMVQPR
jgi:transposase-like protein